MSLEKYVRWHGLSQFLSFPACGWRNLQECIHPQPNCLQSFLWIKLYGFLWGCVFWYHFLGGEVESRRYDPWRQVSLRAVKESLPIWSHPTLCPLRGCDSWERFRSSKSGGPWAGVPRDWNVEIWVTNQSTTFSDCWVGVFGETLKQ